MRILKILAAAAAIAAAPAGAALAQTGPLALGANIGTPGVGVEAQFRVAEGLVVRGAADWLSYSRDRDHSGVPYEGKLKASTVGLFADWHPGGTGFLVSGGAYFGDRRADMSSQPTEPVNIGGATFTPAQIGRLDGKAEMSKVQPFVGLGFDNTFTGDRAWGVRALLGVSFSKSPDVALNASGARSRTIRPSRRACASRRPTSRTTWMT
ncbi:hypothetical protein [Phenylobacterium sp. J367]|uniref:hypothetical protein n=1 Tax=Phenylobacterium sp. J367 TaxID=2898435 RepID=UPI00215098AD|nr:hypothetical protein [Phenylobacterium sp. J367]MCR5879922.1 hypothetical protein [Phenylobacterium sp. J367]